MPDRIGIEANIINMRFEYSDIDIISDIEYPNSDTNRYKHFYTDSISNTIGKYPYCFNHTHHDQARSKKKHEEAGVEEVVSKGRHLKITRVADVWV